MRRLGALSFLLLIFFGYGIYFSQFDLPILTEKIRPGQDSPFYEYRGVLNVQTNLSRGSATPAEVVATAKKLDLDFLILTDVNQFPPAAELNGYFGNTLVSVGGEYSYLDARVLYSSAKKDLYPSDREQAQVFLTDHLSQIALEQKDTLLVLARPLNPGPTWSGPLPTGLDGIEILNPKSISQVAWRRSKILVFWSLLTYPFNPRVSLLRIFQEPEEEAELWDKVLSERPLWGFAGSDASARAIPFANYLFRFPSYAQSLQIAQVHLQLSSELTGNYQKDRNKIFQALKRGHFFSSLDLLANSSGFGCYVLDKETALPMGSQVALRRGLKIVVNLPSRPQPFFEIVVYRNGLRAYTTNDWHLDYNVEEPGVYRVVVRVSPNFPPPEGKKWINWIYSNPFFIK